MTPRVVSVRGQTDPPPGTPTPNLVLTSKYTALTFVPLNLREQFSRYANAYFLSMALLMLLGEHSCLFLPSIRAWSTIALLTMMMLFSAAVAAADDIQRHRRDARVNFERSCKVLGADGAEQTLPWCKLAPGMTVELKEGEEAPADILVFSSSSPERVFFVSTRNLDGETDMKERRAFSLPTASCDIDVSPPAADIYSMDGAVGSNGTVEPFDLNNCVLRGCRIRGVDSVQGAVLFTGEETKVQLNSRAVPCKSPTLDAAINRVMVCSVALQGLLTVASVVAMLTQQVSAADAPYLLAAHEKELCLPPGLAYGISFFVLFSNLVPISLYSTLEVMNVAFSFYVRADKQMLCEDVHAEPRAANLAHELGQVRFFFSDKTGTLTQNRMEVRSFSCGNPPEVFEVGGGKVAQTASSPEAKMFFLSLALCHSARVAADGSWTAPCPEEEAFLAFCRDCGWVLRGEDGDGYLRLLSPGAASPRLFKTLLRFPFDSARKCMSVLVQEKGREGGLLLLKGADSVLLPKKLHSAKALTAVVRRLSGTGLRSLVTSFRIVNEEQIRDWTARHHAARCLPGPTRAAALAALASDVETRFEASGVVAVDDLLQAEVPECMAFLREAQVRVWLLTGDNPLTAEAVALRAGLFAADAAIHRLVGNATENDAIMQALVRRGPALGQDVLVVSGAFLTAAEKKAAAWDQFVHVGMACATVVACRVSPAQKGAVVRAVQEKSASEGEWPVTLAIGDGANDCSMIMEAKVGVGILGREGHQAANASDFSIGAFRAVRQLMFVHGRWDYRRCCKVVLFTFWRNAVQEVMMACYNVESNFSGTPLFADGLRICFNAVCTVHILAVGIFERDTPRAKLLGSAQEYLVGQQGADLNLQTMAVTLAHAGVTGLWLFCALRFSAGALAWQGSGDYYTVNVLAFTMLVVACAVRCGALTVSWDGPIVAAQVLAALAYLAYVCAYSARPGPAQGSFAGTVSSAGAVLLLITFYCLVVCEWLLQAAPRALSQAAARLRTPFHQALLPEEPPRALACARRCSDVECGSARDCVEAVGQQTQSTWSLSTAVPTGTILASSGWLLGFLLFLGAGLQGSHCVQVASSRDDARAGRAVHPQLGDTRGEPVEVAFWAGPLYQNSNGLLSEAPDLWGHECPFHGAVDFSDASGGSCTLDATGLARSPQDSWARPSAFPTVLVRVGRLECGNGSFPATLEVRPAGDITERLRNATHGATDVAWELQLCTRPTARAVRGGALCLLLLGAACAAVTVVAKAAVAK